MYSPLRTNMKTFCDILAAGKLISVIVAPIGFVFAVPKHPKASFDFGEACLHGANPLRTDVRMLAIGIAIDIIILLSPLPLVSKLKMLPRKRKYQMIALFLFGIRYYSPLFPIVH